MKRVVLTFFASIIFLACSAQKIFKSGIVPGNFTTAEMLAIPNPEIGQVIYNTDTQSLYKFNGATLLWELAGEDGLGDHLAGQDLDMAGFDILDTGTYWLEDKSGNGRQWQITETASGKLNFDQTNTAAGTYTLDPDGSPDDPTDLINIFWFSTPGIKLDASQISNTPQGNLVSNNVQAALNELQSQLDGVVAGGSDGSIQLVELNGNSLDFTGSGGGFNGSVDLSGLASAGTQDLANVLTQGNSVGTTDINMNGQSITNATNIETTSIISAGNDISLITNNGGVIDANIAKITQVVNPEDPQDAATKDYVDNAVLTNTGDVKTVDNFTELYALTPNDNDVAVVTAEGVGGTFVYDATQSAVNDGGIVKNGWVRQYSGAVNVKWFGAVGDGVTDDTAAIQNAINYNSLNSEVLEFNKKNYSVTNLAINNSVVNFKESTLTAIDDSDVITIGSNTTFFGDLKINLNNESYTAIRASNADSLKLDLNLNFSNAKTGGDNVNGGLIISGGSNIKIRNIKAENIRQSSSSGGLYRVVDASNVDGLIFKTIDSYNGDIVFNVYASTNINGDNINSLDDTANALYLINNTENVFIESVKKSTSDGSKIGLGISFDSDISNSNIYIGNASISNCYNGIDLRDGGGYSIGSLSLFDSSMSDNALGLGVSSINIGSFACVINSTDLRAITLTKSNNVNVNTGSIVSNVIPLSSNAIKLSSTADNFHFKGTVTDLSSGFNVVASFADVSDPFITFDINSNISSPTVALTSIADYEDVFIKINEVVFSGKNGIESLVDVPTLSLKSNDLSVGTSQEIGSIEMVSSDTSSGGSGTKFKIKTYSQTSIGTLYATAFENSSGSTVGFINSSGMTIVPPSSSNSLPTGSLWVDSGELRFKDGDYIDNQTASEVPITDTADNFTDDTVEGALAELASSGGGDNLGNHLATQNIDMSGNSINNLQNIGFDRSPTAKVDIYESNGTSDLKIESENGFSVITISSDVSQTNSGGQPEIRFNHNGEQKSRFRYNQSNDKIELTRGTGSGVVAFGIDSNSNTQYNGDVDLIGSSPFLSIEGNDSSFSNAGLQLKSTNATNNRAMGTYAWNDNDDTEWYWGRPYSPNDGFVVKRWSTPIPSSETSPPGQGSSSTATDMFRIENNGNITVSGKISGVEDGTNASDAVNRGQLDAAISGISGGSPQNLENVLAQGNSAGSSDIDMSEQNITNVNTVDANAIINTGDVSIIPSTGIIDANVSRIRQVVDPIDNQDAATKNYVDNLNVDDADANPTNEIQNLEQVLTQDNDANDLDILNVNSIDPTRIGFTGGKRLRINYNSADASNRGYSEIASNIMYIFNPTLPSGETLNYNFTTGKYSIGSNEIITTANVGGGTDDQTASEVPFTPNGSIAATNVQDAIQEVRDEAGGSVNTGYHSFVELTDGFVLDYSNQVTGSGYRVFNGYSGSGDITGTLDNIRTSTVNENYSILSNGSGTLTLQEGTATFTNASKGSNNAIQLDGDDEVSLIETSDGNFRVSGSYSWVTVASVGTNLFTAVSQINPDSPSTATINDTNVNGTEDIFNETNTYFGLSYNADLPPGATTTQSLNYFRDPSNTARHYRLDNLESYITGYSSSNTYNLKFWMKIDLVSGTNPNVQLLFNEGGNSLDVFTSNNANVTIDNLGQATISQSVTSGWIEIDVNISGAGGPIQMDIKPDGSTGTGWNAKIAEMTITE